MINLETIVCVALTHKGDKEVSKRKAKKKYVSVMETEFEQKGHFK
jgi:hypothetical protein